MIRPLTRALLTKNRRGLLTSTLVVNLDTSHISEIAREKIRLDSLIGCEDVVMCLSLQQLAELSAPIRSRPFIRDALAEVSLVFVNSLDIIYPGECQAACDRLFQRSSVRLPHIFVNRFGNQFNDQQSTVLGYFDYFAAFEHQRQKMLAPSKFGAELANSSGFDARIISDPLCHVTDWMRDYLAIMRADDSDYAGTLTAEEVVDRLGGEKELPLSFPLFGVLQRLAQTRIQNKLKSVHNDVIDEYNASCAAYAAVTSVDRRTLYRFKQAKLPAADRVVMDLSSVPTVLARVRSGEFSPVPSFPFK